MIVDAHCHLDDPAFAGDLEAVLDRARERGVRMITAGTSPDSSRAALRLARSRPDVLACVGIHPHAADAFPTPDPIRDLAPESAGIGETGLDYFRPNASRERQRALLAGHLALAREFRKPLVLHCREAYEDLFEMLRSEASPPVAGMLHCFTGTYEQARAALDLGLYISFSGILTFRGAHALRAVAARLPPDRVLIETDAPYLAPEPHRGRRNEPAFVAATGRVLAGIFSMTEERMFQITAAGAVRLFGPIP